MSVHESSPVRHRPGDPDAYGILLVLVLASIVSAAFANSPLSRVIVVTIQLTMFSFALWTSRASRRVVLAFVVCLVVVFVGGGAAVAVGGATSSTMANAAGAGLALAAIVAIVRRVVTAHPVADAATILGAVDVYLLVGLLFASVFGVIASVDAGTLFAQSAGDGTALERIYFSFVTLTTVGYGDLTARTDVARVFAISEALLGQIYLVTVVALLVGSAGGRRRSERDG